MIVQMRLTKFVNHDEFGKIDEFCKTLHETLHKMNMKSQAFFVVGDFNVDVLNIDRDNNVHKYFNHLLIELD